MISRGTMAFSFPYMGQWNAALLLLVDEPFLFPTVWFLAESRLYRIPLGVPPKARDFCLCRMLFGVRWIELCTLGNSALKAVPSRFFSIENRLVGALSLASLSYLTQLFQRSLDHSNVLRRFGQT